MPPLAHPTVFRVRRSRRPASAEKMLDPAEKRNRSEARIQSLELVHPLLQALRPATRWIYVCLRAKAIKRRGMKWFIGYGELATLSGHNVKTVKNGIAELLAVGLVKREVRFDYGPGWRAPGWLPTEYTVLSPVDVDAAEVLRTLAMQAQAQAGDVDDELGPELDVDGLVLQASEEGEEGTPALSLAEVESAARALRETALRQSAEVSAEASARALRVALVHEREQLARATAELMRLVRIPSPEGRQRVLAHSEARIAFQAIAARADAGTLLDQAERQISGLLEAVDQGAPVGSWSGTLLAIRLALPIAQAAVYRAGEAVALTKLAADTWLNALKRLPRKSFPPAPLWRPPESWNPLAGPRTARTWRQQRETWEQAKAAGAGKVLERLRAQGFDPAYQDPDPPPTV